MSTEKKYQNRFIFDYLGNILGRKSEETYRKHVEDSENFKSFPSVVILRYLSMCPDPKVRDIIFRNQIYLERLDKISHEKLYLWLLKNIPKQSSTFIPYLGGK